MSATRAQKRRDLKARVKATEHAESGFKDRSVYMPFVLAKRAGSLWNDAYTADELHQRAVARADQRRMIEKLVAEQKKATVEAGVARKLDAKTRRRIAYLAACAKPQPTKYMHSAARQRAAVAQLALAA